MNIGDKVRVVDSGQNFSSYPDWIRKYARKYEEKYHGYGYSPDKDSTVYTIVAKGPHKWSEYGMLYLIESDTNVFLMGESGLKVVEDAHPLLLVSPQGFGNGWVEIGTEDELKNVIESYGGTGEFQIYKLTPVFKMQLKTTVEKVK